MAKSVTAQRQETLDKAESLMAEVHDLYVKYFQFRIGNLEELWQDLDEIKGNLEEKFSGTERYQRLEELVESLETAKAELESAKDSLPSEMQYSDVAGSYWR